MAEYIEMEALRRAIFDAEWLNSQDEDVAYDVLESVPAADVAPVVRWISVEDRLPDNEDVVLCVTKNKRPFVCRYDHYWKHWRVSGSVKVTHWMPLPEPPHCGAKMDGGKHETD